jgi:hypothetical protein
VAQITKDHIEKIEKNSREHGVVECQYSINYINGKKFIQFDTFGSPDREYTGSVSQSIQFDEETAEYLLGILNFEFKDM